VDTDHDGVPDSPFHLVIERFAGPSPDSVKYIYGASDARVREYATRGLTLFGHPMAEGAMAVGAAPYFGTAAYDENVASAVGAPFSSLGGVLILFTKDGIPTGPIVRQKPDVTGTDTSNNTFFGSDVGLDRDAFPNFFGTSAAPPHVAAVAALVLDNRPELTPGELYQTLRDNAEDVTRRFTRNAQVASVGAGVDRWSGHGYVRARQAALPVELASFDAVAEGTAAVLTWRTASETNNAGFAIEHRPPGARAFTEVDFVEGAGTTEKPQTYRHRVEELRVGTHRFRLRQVDLDGSSTRYDPVSVTVRLDAAAQLSPVQPNPMRTDATLELAVRETQSVRVEVFNVLGQRVRVLHEGPLEANSPTTLRISGTDLPSGVYFVRAQGEQFSTTRRFVHVR
jgi:hypothetical protein